MTETTCPRCSSGQVCTTVGNPADVAAAACLTRSPEWRQEHPERHSTIITVQPGTTMGYVLGHLAEAVSGSPVYLAMITDTDVRVVPVSEERWSLELTEPRSAREADR